MKLPEETNFFGVVASSLLSASRKSHRPSSVADLLDWRIVDQMHHGQAAVSKEEKRRK